MQGQRSHNLLYTIKYQQLAHRQPVSLIITSNHRCLPCLLSCSTLFHHASGVEPTAVSTSLVLNALNGTCHGEFCLNLLHLRPGSGVGPTTGGPRKDCSLQAVQVEGRIVALEPFERAFLVEKRGGFFYFYRGQVFLSQLLRTCISSMIFLTMTIVVHVPKGARILGWALF